MEDMYRDKMFNNISYFVKTRGRKVSDLEAAAKVSTGYIARTKDGTAKPSLDFAVCIAQELGVSIDTLINVDLSKLTPSEQYVYDFLEKLNKDTYMGLLDWEQDSAYDLNNLVSYSDGSTDHPLMRFHRYTAFSEGEEKEFARVLFKSRSYGNSTTINGDCYSLDINNGVTVYVMNIAAPISHDATSKEIWLCDDNGIAQFLCGSIAQYPFSQLLEELYTTISNYQNHPMIKPCLHGAIDAFMGKAPKYEDSDENGELPF